MPNVPVSNKVLQELIEKTNTTTGMFSQKVFKDTLRFLIKTFGKIHFVDRNNNSINVKCFHASQERAFARSVIGDNITLPVITVSESNTEVANDRARYGSLLLHDIYWHRVQQRAIRTLSLVPTPVTINYSINIWCKYREDLDQIREYILTIFNPDLEIETDHNGKIKSFITGESDVEQAEAADKDDRLLKKNFSISVETYIPNPRFFYTSTGKIEKLNYEIELADGTETVEGTIQGSKAHSAVCSCSQCLLPLVLIDGSDSSIQVDCEAISIIQDGIIGS